MLRICTDNINIKVIYYNVHIMLQVQPEPKIATQYSSVWWT